MPNDTLAEQTPTSASEAKSPKARRASIVALVGLVAAAVATVAVVGSPDTPAPNLTLVAARTATEMASTPSPLDTEFALAAAAKLPATTATAYELVPDDLAKTAALLSEVLSVQLKQTEYGYESRSTNARVTLDKAGTWNYASMAPLAAPCATGPGIPPPDKAVDAPNDEIPLEVPKDAIQCVPPAQTVLDDVNTRKKAAALFAALGADETSAVVSTYGSATTETVVDGVKTGVKWSARYNADGKLESASGVAATARALGSYAVVSSTDAASRLNVANWVYANTASTTMTPLSESGMTSDESTASSTTISPKFDTSGAIPNTAPVQSIAPPVSQAESVPPSPPTAPETTGVLPRLTDERPVVIEKYETMQVKLTAAQLVLHPHHTTLNGAPRVLLLPTWEFSAANGGVWFALALDEAVVTFAPAPAGSQSAQPQPSAPALSQVELVRIKVVGMTEEAAVEFVKAEGFTVRVSSRDNESFPLTMDYRDDRVNLVVVAGSVTASGVG
jgi:hypothetical protein